MVNLTDIQNQSNGMDSSDNADEGMVNRKAMSIEQWVQIYCPSPQSSPPLGKPNPTAYHLPNWQSAICHWYKFPFVLSMSNRLQMILKIAHDALLQIRPVIWPAWQMTLIREQQNIIMLARPVQSVHQTRCVPKMHIFI